MLKPIHVRQVRITYTVDDPTSPLPGLSPFAGRPLKACFDGATLSPDAGVLVLFEVEGRLGVVEHWARHLDSSSDLASITRSTFDMVRFRMSTASTAGRRGSVRAPPRLREPTVDLTTWAGTGSNGVSSLSRSVTTALLAALALGAAALVVEPASAMPVTSAAGIQAAAPVDGAAVEPVYFRNRGYYRRGFGFRRGFGYRRPFGYRRYGYGRGIPGHPIRRILRSL